MRADAGIVDDGTPFVPHGRSHEPIVAQRRAGSEISGRASDGQIAQASWPGTTPAGKVSKDIISLADPHATFAELAGAKLPDGMKFDGHSFAPQLLGKRGQPREWAYVQLGPRWFVRESGFKLNEQGELFDMRDAPFVEKLIATDADTDSSKAARARLTAVLAELNPAAGKTDRGGGNANKAAKKAKQRAKTAT